MVRISEFILNFVLNSAWQIVAIFAVALLVSRLLRNGPARYRHTLWVVAMAASLFVPLLTTTRVVPAMMSSFWAAAPAVPIPSQSSTVTSFEDLKVDHIGPSRHKTFSIQSRDILLLTFIYALFICGRGIRLARFWQRLRRWRQSVTGSVPEIQAVAQRCRTLLKTGVVPIGLSNYARVPATIGTLRPLIVLPK